MLRRDVSATRHFQWQCSDISMRERCGRSSFGILPVYEQCLVTTVLSIQCSLVCCLVFLCLVLGLLPGFPLSCKHASFVVHKAKSSSWKLLLVLMSLVIDIVEFIIIADICLFVFSYFILFWLCSFAALYFFIICHFSTFPVLVVGCLFVWFFWLVVSASNSIFPLAKLQTNNKSGFKSIYFNHSTQGNSTNY